MDWLIRQLQRETNRMVFTVEIKAEGEALNRLVVDAPEFESVLNDKTVIAALWEHEQCDMVVCSEMSGNTRRYHVTKKTLKGGLVELSFEPFGKPPFSRPSGVDDDD